MSHLFRYTFHLRILYSNHRRLWGSLYSKVGGDLGHSQLLLTLQKEHCHDLHSGHFQCCERLLYFDITDPGDLAIANALEEKNWGLRNIHDGPCVSPVDFMYRCASVLIATPVPALLVSWGCTIALYFFVKVTLRGTKSKSAVLCTCSFILRILFLLLLIPPGYLK